jgi:hypothetical protein
MVLFLNTYNTAEFFEFVERFDLNMAKKRALNLLKRGVNSCNYYELYNFSLNHELPELKSAVFQFIKNNLWEVATTEDWVMLPDEMRLKFFESQLNDPLASMASILDKREFCVEFSGA